MSCLRQTTTNIWLQGINYCNLIYKAKALCFLDTLQKGVKYKAMYEVFWQIEALLSLKKVWLPTIFFLDTKSTC